MVYTFIYLTSVSFLAIQTFIIRPSSQDTIVGQMVTFDCHVEGIPKPRILWRVKHYNSNNINNSFVRIDSLDQRRFKLLPNGTLMILNVHFSDKGLYACVAISPGKKNNATAYLTVYGEFQTHMIPVFSCKSSIILSWGTK